MSCKYGDIEKQTNKWPISRLGDDVVIKGRVGWKGYKTSDLRDSGPIVIGGGNIKNSLYLDLTEIKHLSREKYEESPDIMLQKEDLIIVTRGNGIGDVSYYNGDLEEATINPSVVILSEYKGNPKFLFYYLISSMGKNNVLSYKSGSSIPAIYQNQLAKIEYPKPSIEEQNRIVELLQPLDEKIYNNNQMNKTLEEMAQSIFKRWFVDFEFPNEDGEPYKSSGGEMVESELGMIPKGWEVKKMKDISSLMMGISPKSSSYNNDCIGVPLLNGAGDFYNGKIKPTKYTTEAKRICKNGDIILSIRGTIGNLNFSDGEYCLGRSMCALRGKEDIDNMLIFMYMLKSIEQLKSNAIGSVIVGLSKPDIEGIVIAYPNYEIRKSINDILSNLYCRKKYNIEENNNINAIRESLLSKLMSGDSTI